MKALSIFLCLVMIGTAVGRFHAETEVRAARSTLAQLDKEIAQAQARVEMVRLDVEVLESAGRLGTLNAERLGLATVRAEQVLDSRDFAEIVGIALPEKAPEVPRESDVIGNAIGMAELSWVAAGEED